ncbi:hypothetical protein LCGC14_2996180, partial [marine sediment metagenome]
SNIPTGSTVNTATLTIYSKGTDASDNARALEIYRIIRKYFPFQYTTAISFIAKKIR